MARPFKYKDSEELQAAIDAYFESCEGKPLIDAYGDAVLDKYGQPVIVGAKPPTVTGLALALGFAGRQALLNYQGRAQFKDTITRAKARIEAYVEGRLFDRDGVQGAKFSLTNNFKGWRDRPDPEPEKEPDNNLLEAIRKSAKDFKEGPQ